VDAGERPEFTHGLVGRPFERRVLARVVGVDGDAQFDPDHFLAGYVRSWWLSAL
jgi:hypothetical protein